MNAGTSTASLIPNRQDDWIVRTNGDASPPCSGPCAGRTGTVPAQTDILLSLS
ncbi:hypothetical protein J2848_003722 [Azospirillum lipoferum]|nr:hypothetical protein [Azospirillum lipoferum]